MTNQADFGAGLMRNQRSAKHFPHYELRPMAPENSQGACAERNQQ